MAAARLAAVIAFLLLAAAAPPAPPAPAPAPVPATPKIVPDCRQRADDIVVCGTRGERSPYRLPPQHEGFDPEGSVPSVARERHKLYEVGETGIGSCSNVGPGGWTGCQFKTWKEGRQQRAGKGTISVGPWKKDSPKP